MKKKHRSLDSKSRALIWLLDDGKGLSAKNLCRAWFMGSFRPDDYPHDTSDAGRCVRFLRMVPEAVHALDLLAAEVPQWAAWKNYILEQLKQAENEKNND